jgi:hypothetical protein
MLVPQEKPVKLQILLVLMEVHYFATIVFRHATATKKAPKKVPRKAPKAAVAAEAAGVAGVAGAAGAAGVAEVAGVAEAAEEKIPSQANKFLLRR